MTLIARMRRTFAIIRHQQLLIRYQRHLLQSKNAEIARLKLNHMREIHGLASAWRLHMETPEIDLRDDISALATDLGNQIAALEEHVLT